MKSRPIIFSAPMVLALLAGTKTQTRRVIKDQTIGERFCEMRPEGAYLEWLGTPCCGTGVWDVPEYSGMAKVPYGVVGDQLWVRESFIHEPADYVWEASVSIPCRPASTVYRADCKGDSRGAGWTSPMFMPRSLSRITLELTDVRVERLQDISAVDAWAEGIPGAPPPGVYIERVDEWARWSDGVMREHPRDAYRALWESINGPGSWDANPFVWALSFKRV